VRTLNNLNIPQEIDKKDPVLVAVSFGPDSMALLYRLIEAGFLDIHVIHVHHGLRKESDDELLALQNFCKERNLKFFYKRLPILSSMNNLEDTLRQERFLFFKEIYFKIEAKALFLGQQANEQVETGLKRLFEGAHFSQLKGIEFEKNLWGMRVIRPQLSDWKEDILAYLAHHKIPFAIDQSNFSDRFLRGRMRKEMIPQLKRQFGKELEKNIHYFMEKITDWNAHLEKRIEVSWSNKIFGPYGDFFSKEFLDRLDQVELDYLFYKAEIKHRAIRKRLLAHWSNQEFGKKLHMESWIVHVEQVGIFIQKKPIELEQTHQKKGELGGWLTFWKGENGYFPTEKKERWAKLQALKPALREKILKEYSRQKIPIFLRKNVYVLEDQGKVIYDILSLCYP